MSTEEVLHEISDAGLPGRVERVYARGPRNNQLPGPGVERRGVRLQGDVLEAVDATTNVRLREGEVEVDYGPRVEIPAPASGFNLLECTDLDEAIEVSAKHPIARYGVIELRPIADG